VFFQLNEAIKASFASFKLRFEERCRADNEAALRVSVDAYKTSMEAVCGGKKPYLDKSAFDREHTKNKNLANQIFRDKPKMGGMEFSSGEKVGFTTMNALGQTKFSRATYVQKVKHFFLRIFFFCF
jgi:hypothetical protein